MRSAFVAMIDSVIACPLVLAVASLSSSDVRTAVCAKHFLQRSFPWLRVLCCLSWRFLPSSETGPLFCVSSSKEVSYDSWRKALRCHFTDAAGTIGTHSLRKGGASWLKFHVMMSDDAVQAQGGWASAETMHKFYASFPEEAQHSSLERGFERFSFENSAKGSS